jgi:hypothetical protein
MVMTPIASMTRATELIYSRNDSILMRLAFNFENAATQVKNQAKNMPGNS